MSYDLRKFVKKQVADFSRRRFVLYVDHSLPVSDEAFMESNYIPHYDATSSGRLLILENISLTGKPLPEVKVSLMDLLRPLPRYSERRS